MKILITGANGLLGYKLVQLLSHQADIQVIATGRRMIPDLPAHVTFSELDITDPVQTENVIHHVKPDVVINTAAMTQVDQCEVERDLCWKANIVKSCVRARYATAEW